MLFMLKNKNYILLMFQKIIRILKKQVILLMIRNEEKRKAMPRHAKLSPKDDDGIILQ